MIIEAHIQCSPEDEDCERCSMMVPEVDFKIPAFTDYFVVIHDEEENNRQENVCAQHFATLQFINPPEQEQEE